MTNREYLTNFLKKHFNVICILFYILDVVSVICVIKISPVFFAIFVPFTSGSIILTYIQIDMWLDKERKGE